MSTGLTKKEVIAELKRIGWVRKAKRVQVGVFGQWFAPAKGGYPKFLQNGVSIRRACSDEFIMAKESLE